MIITIDNTLRLEYVPIRILEQIRAELTIKNPEYARKKAIGLNRWAWGPEYIKLFDEKKVDGRIQDVIPRGYYARIYEIAKGAGNTQFFDKRLKFPPITYPQKPELRDYQVPAIERAKDWQQGVIIMPCGSGKTETAMGITAELGQPTLWITHTMDLLNQSMDRAKSRLGLSGNQIGIIQGENMSIGSHMSFATVQTLAKRDLSEIRNKFGCVIVDEAHLVFKDAAGVRMFESVISQFPAYYRFGITASDHRSDGLIETMFHIIGPKFYEVGQDNPRLRVVTPRVKFVETDFMYVAPEGEMLSVQQMYKAMREDASREHVIKKILNVLKNDHCCLVLGDSLEHLEALCDYVQCRLIRMAAFICGTTPKKKREEIISSMRDGGYNFLFATYQLAKLGLDIPRLDSLVLITPHRDKTSVQQAVGRIMRPFEGKPQPVVYDIYDSRVRQLVFWARERTKVYKRLGCQVDGGPKVRKW